MKVGDVVRIINLEYLEESYYNIGDLVQINYIKEPRNTSFFKYKIYDKHDTEWWLGDWNFEKLNDTEEFFNFLHPNMEMTYRKELFDKLYKQFKQDRNEKI